MILACICGVIVLYVTEWLYLYKKNNAYVISMKIINKKMFWRFFNAIQLVVYMGFPSLLQM